MRTATDHVRRVATHPIPTPTETGRRYFLSAPLRLAVTAARTRMHSKPSRNTSTPTSTTAEVLLFPGAAKVELPRVPKPYTIKIPVIRRMPTRRIASQTFRLWRDVRKTELPATIRHGVRAGLASSAILISCPSAPDPLILKIHLLFLFRFLLESLPTSGRVFFPLLRCGILVWPLAPCARTNRGFPSKR